MIGAEGRVVTLHGADPSLSPWARPHCRGRCGAPAEARDGAHCGWAIEAGEGGAYPFANKAVTRCVPAFRRLRDATREKTKGEVAQ